jgi:Family of unknown function (DUF5681)
MSPRRGRNRPIRGRQGGTCLRSFHCNINNCVKRLYMGGDSPEDKMSGTRRQYAANYRKPPVHTRFKKGQSGNPRGRPAKKLAALLAAALNEKVTVTENGKRRQVTKREVARPRRGSVSAIRQRRERSGCRHGGDRRRDHPAAPRDIRPEHAWRPVSRRLRALIEAKLKSLPLKPREVITPPPVIDLMAALKRSLAQELLATGAMTAKQRRPKPAANRRQRSLLLPLAGGRRRKEQPTIDPASVAASSRKKALTMA